MRRAVFHSPGDIRVEERPDPAIEHPTDAVIRLSATCVCGPTCGPTEDQAAEGYRAMDGRRAIKTLLTV
jgi:threonine dehydrogenase-like Zn-dependent dehydrogenase